MESICYVCGNPDASVGRDGVPRCMPCALGCAPADEGGGSRYSGAVFVPLRADSKPVGNWDSFTFLYNVVLG